MRRSFYSLFIFLTLAAASLPAHAQDKAYAKQLIDTLTAPYFAGRGYVDSGMPKAATFIAAEFKKLGLKPLFRKRSYLQGFPMSVNAFPGKLQVELDGRLLKPGVDYLVSPASSGFEKQSLKLQYLDSAYLAQMFEDKAAACARASAAVIEKNLLKQYPHDTLIIKLNQLGYKMLVMEEPGKLTWSVSRWVEPFPQLIIKKEALAGRPDVLTAEIEQSFWPMGSFPSQNVGAYIKGKQNPDSFIFITAHYDHLGMMGREAMFPGANDNASGTAMMLDLARHYSKKENRPAYSIAFMAFGAEEAGLVGSRYFVENPPLPLKKIAMVINIDLMANGQDGMTVVNATEFPRAFRQLVEINKEYSYLKEIRSRGKAANSDHYWFAKKGVPAFFFYLLGEYPHYHDVNDTAEKPKLEGYEGAFRLVRDFIATYR